MSIETMLLLIIIILIAGTFPAWPHSKSWGYTPAGVLTLLLVIFLIWAIAGGRPLFRSSTLQEVGQDLKATGHDAADAVRRAVE